MNKIDQQIISYLVFYRQRGIESISTWALSILLGCSEKTILVRLTHLRQMKIIEIIE